MSEKLTCSVCDLHSSRLYYDGYCPNAFNNDESPRSAAEHLEARQALMRVFGADSVLPLDETGAKDAIERYETEYHKHGELVDCW